MGGEIGAESELGAGSRFWFTALVGIPGEQPQGPTVRQLMGRRVIVVAGHRPGGAVLRNHLKVFGAEADVARDEAEALAFMTSAARQQRPYALAVVDCHPGASDPAAVTRAIRTGAPAISTTAILCSTGSREKQHQAVAAGCDGAVAKPVRRAQLREAVEDVLSDARRRPEPAGVVARERTGGARLLVAEDNPVNQAVLVQMLRRRGYQTEVARDGLEALEKISGADYAAVLMDCQMPRMNGYDATAEIRRAEGHGRRTPIIAVTAHAMAADRDTCIAAGMDDHVAKPVRAAELDAVLGRWVAPGIDEVPVDAVPVLSRPR